VFRIVHSGKEPEHWATDIPNASESDRHPCWVVPGTGASGTDKIGKRSYQKEQYSRYGIGTQENAQYQESPVIPG
jgi:hypothetical protein